MYLTFRQGIARYQTDVNGMPAFLKKTSQTGQYVDLIVSPDPTVIIFAHKDANYVFEETKTITKAWGPFPDTPNSTEYLYWDVSILDGSLSRGFTTLEPIYSSVAPTNPQIDQHWFDNQVTVMKVWNGSKWLEKIRVFAAKYSSTAVLISYPIGSQANISGQFEGGNLVLDSFNKPLRQNDGTFVTSATKLTLIGNSSSIQLESQQSFAMANEYIAKFSLVQIKAGRRIILGRPSNPFSRISGIVTEDLYESESGVIITNGLIKNEQWSFSEDQINRPVFCGPTGEVTLVPPTKGVCQIAGFVFDTDSIYVDIKQPVIIDNVEIDTPAPAPAPILSAPVANFDASTRTGTAPLTVTFTSTTTSNPSLIEWDFNNSGVVDSVGETVTHTFLKPGKYSVRLHAVNKYGQDDNVKMDHITVLAAPTPGSKTNLEARLGAPQQVRVNQVFSVSATANNDGLMTATNVIRKISISNFSSANLNISNLPEGSTLVNDKGRAIITLPVISRLQSNKPVNTLFNITAPSAPTRIEIFMTVESREIDASSADNTAKISITVKP